MKKSSLLLTTACITASAAFSQVDYCAVLNIAIPATDKNFSAYNNFQHKTQGGQSAYLADFTFVPGGKAYVYKDDVKQETFFFQGIATDTSQYRSIYRSIELCLVNQPERWTKLDGKENRSVMFSCNKTGSNIILIRGNASVTIEMKRDARKNKPVFIADFCTNIEKLASACNDNFSGLLGKFKDSSSILGKRYESLIHLNQRGYGASIAIARDFMDKSKPANSYTELISEGDMSFEDVMKYVQQCLTSANGWTKNEKRTDGLGLIKNGVEVTVTKSNSVISGEPASVFIGVKNFRTF